MTTGVAKRPSARPPSPGRTQAGTGSFAVEVRTHVQERKKAARQKCDEQRHERIPGKMRRNERVARRVREERRLAEERDEDGVGDDAGEERRNQRVGLEVVAIEHFDREQRGAERRAKHGRHAAGHAGDEKNAPLAGADPQIAAHERADGAADLHRGPLATARAAGSQRENRGQRLDADDAPAHDAPL